MMLHVSAHEFVLWLFCCCWIWFTYCCCWEWRSLTLQFCCLIVACSHYHTEWRWCLMAVEKGFMGEARWRQLLGSLGFCVVFWWNLGLEHCTLQPVCTRLVLWLVKILGKGLRRDYFQAFHSLFSWDALADGEFHWSFHYGSIVIDVRCFSWVIVWVYSNTIFVAVTQRSECFGTRRPRFKGVIDSLVHLTHLLVVASSWSFSGWDLIMEEKKSPLVTVLGCVKSSTWNPGGNLLGHQTRAWKQWKCWINHSSHPKFLHL